MRRSISAPGVESPTRFDVTPIAASQSSPADLSTRLISTSLHLPAAATARARVPARAPPPTHSCRPDGVPSSRWYTAEAGQCPPVLTALLLFSSLPPPLNVFWVAERWNFSLISVETEVRAPWSAQRGASPPAEKRGGRKEGGNGAWRIASFNIKRLILGGRVVEL